MRLNILSDVHLEFEKDKSFSPGEGDVLVLAGDICTACDFGTGSDSEQIYLNFFDECVKNYNKVFYTLGNHEHYNYDITKTEDTLRKYLPEGITILNNSSEYYDGHHFVGLTLWADFKNANQNAMRYAQDCMSDYHCITKDGKMLTPKDTLQLHDESISWLRQALPMLRGPIIVFSHHAPSLLSNQGYREAELVGAYCTDLTKLIENHPNLVQWIHGHVHVSSNYNIEQCNVIANPRGYSNYKMNEEFSPNKQVLL